MHYGADGVPEAALDRFLQLVTAAELSERPYCRVSLSFVCWCAHVAIEADVYNASIPKSYGNVFETELLKNVLLAATKSNGPQLHA
eukprot:4287-Heterococcus_DN1.PRE.2